MASSKAKPYGVLLVGALTLAGVTGCSDQSASAAPADQARGPAAPAATNTDLPEVLATVGDQQITLADVRARTGSELDLLEVRYRIASHRLVNNSLREILRERVLLDEAKKQGKTVEEMITAEAGGSFAPTDLEIQAWYDENQSRVGGRTLDQVRSQIAQVLEKEKQVEALDRLQERINKERGVVVHLEPIRFQVDDPSAPSMGPKNAPVTLVEFSDFQCPFCARFHPTLKRLTDKYGDQLRIVYRQYPIPSLHPNAVKAAEASLCANDQGKFWEAHDLMFQEQNRLAVRDLKVMAGRLDLDQKQFDSCLDTGKYAEKVQNDMADAQRVGVTGTPALFVNGVVIEGGAVPFEAVVRAIDQELGRVKK